MGKFTDLLNLGNNIKGLSDKLDQHYLFFNDVFTRFCLVNESLDKLIESFQNFSENRNHLDDLAKKIQDSNEDYLKKLDVTRQLMNELHGLAGIVRAQFSETRKEKSESDKIATENLISYQRIEDQLLSLNLCLKELSDERKENRPNCGKKVCSSEKTSESGHEDAPKRKAGRPRTIKKAEEVN